MDHFTHLEELRKSVDHSTKNSINNILPGRGLARYYGQVRRTIEGIEVLETILAHSTSGEPAQITVMLA